MKKIKVETTTLARKPLLQMHAFWGKQYVLPIFKSQFTLSVAVIVTIVALGFLLRRRRPKRCLTGDGYVVIVSKLGRIQSEHRVVAEGVLGRRLEAWEIVHHINGRRCDNDPKNLCVMDYQEHERYHEWYQWIFKKYGKYPRRATQLRKLRDELNGKLLLDFLK